jgi:hypothetical protein
VRRAALLALLLSALAATPALADSLTATLTRADFNYKSATELDGRVLTDAGAPIAGAAVVLQANPYPYRQFSDVAHTVSAADGSFAFPGLLPDRNTRYRASEGQALSPVVTAVVEATGVTHLYHLAYGFLQATVLSYHNSAFDWGGQPAYWFIAKQGSENWQLEGVTRTHERKPGVTYMTLTFLPPKGKFDWRVCFNTPTENAYGPPSTHHPCPHGNFRDVVPAP